jgi:hypothetical protein
MRLVAPRSLTAARRGSQRIAANRRYAAGTATGKDQAMSRWQRVVDNLLTDLETAIPGADGFRGNIDHKIWEAEQTVSFAIPMTPYETTVRRLHGFQRELIERLSKQLKNDPANEICWRLDPCLKTRGSAFPNINERT